MRPIFNRLVLVLLLGCSSEVKGGGGPSSAGSGGSGGGASSSAQSSGSGAVATGSAAGGNGGHGGSVPPDPELCFSQMGETQCEAIGCFYIEATLFPGGIQSTCDSGKPAHACVWYSNGASQAPATWRRVVPEGLLTVRTGYIPSGGLSEWVQCYGLDGDICQCLETSE